MNSVNLFYLTEECNMNCEYCYERKSRAKKKELKTATHDEINKFIDSVIDREGDSNSSIRLFGGEPLLYPAKALYFVEEVLRRKPNTGLNLLTNGTLILNDKTFDYVKAMYAVTKNRMSFKFEISWDGTGHFRRIYNDGSPTRKDVENAMSRLCRNNLPFAVSYAVHNGNKDHVVKDYIYLMEKYGNCVIKNVDYTYVQIEVEEKPHKKELCSYAKKLWKIYKVPMCSNMVCSLCRRCNKTQDNLAISVPGKDLFNRNMYQNREWDYFDEGVNK